MTMEEAAGYTGIENLEVMAEARNYNAWLVSLIVKHAPRGAKVLDFGAGSGTFAEAVRSAGFDVACVEPDPTLRQLLVKKGFDVHGDFASLAGQSFDFIYSLNVFEHIDDDVAAAKALSRHVRPGGGLFVFVPAFPVLYSSMDRLVGHCRRYKRDTLRPILETAGLTVEACRYGDSIGFFAALAFKFVGDDTGKINRGALKFYDSWIFPLSCRLDAVTGAIFGKNVMAYAVKRPA